MGICCSSDRLKLEKQKKQLRRKVIIESLVGGMDVMGATAALAKGKVSPEHLVVMVNGLAGSASEWEFAAQQFVKLLPEKVIVRCCQCNPSWMTFDGVDLMGERLADEVLTVVSHRPELQKISFIAHSLGGLVARYAIGRLYEPLGNLEENSSCILERHGEDCKDRIAGLEPMNFITVASPHLGSQGHNQFPCLCGLSCLERKVTQTAHLIAGRSGEHLFLTDHDEGKPPLLVRMVSDSYELKFISALRAFKRRVTYANAHNDHLVGWCTSSICRWDELQKVKLLQWDEKYPHIFYMEHKTFGDGGYKDSSCVENQITDFEEEMIRGLNQVPWERIHVNFHKSTQRWFAHSTIQQDWFLIFLAIGAVFPIYFTMLPYWAESSEL